LKTVGGRKVARGFESHPRRSTTPIPLNHAANHIFEVFKVSSTSTAWNRLKPPDRGAQWRTTGAQPRARRRG
jgi:hypothetical protein